jgi:hypothetical protein
VCPSRAQQRPLPGDGWKVLIVPPWRAWLRPGTGALRSKARRNTAPVISGSREARISGRLTRIPGDQGLDDHWQKRQRAGALQDASRGSAVRGAGGRLTVR